LHQQIKTIQEELGEKSHEQDIEELRERAKSKNGVKKFRILLKNKLVNYLG